MNINVVYPLPLDNWATFKPAVETFCRTWREFPPGADCELICLSCQADPDPDQRELFAGIANVAFHRYDGTGFDIGAHQHWAFECGQAFNVNVSSRVYFHQAGWLAKLLSAREYFGPGLFGSAVSRETGVLHFRTHCYALDAFIARRYPYLINSKEQSYAFEHGAYGHPAGSLLQWVRSQGDLAFACVYFDGGWRESEWFYRPNIFRRGDQSNLLVWDRHTDLWSGCNQTQKDRLSQMAGVL